MSRARGRIAIMVSCAGLGALILAAPAYAGNLANGLVDVISGPLELPKQIIVGTLTGPPIIGTLAGAVTGAFAAIGTTLRGVAEVAAGSVSLGSSLAPYVLPFVL